LKTETGQSKSFIKMRIAWLLPVCLALATLFFLTGASEYTSQTDFCQSCHEMNKVVSTWQNSIHGANESGIVAECKDCHIPRNLGNKLVVKAGKLKELYVHSVVRPTNFEFRRMTPELADRARSKIDDQNCLACHDLKRQVPNSETQQIAHSTSVGTAACVSCHQWVGHAPREIKKEGEIR